MALVLIDRAQETATANTTVSFTLGGASTGYQSLAGVGNGNTTYYGATDGTNWEVGLGTYSTTGPTLTRTTVYSSSNAGAAVTFSGAVTVFVDYPSSQAVYEDAANTITGYAISGGSINNTPIGATTPSTIAGTNISSATAPTNTVPALALTGTPNNAAGGKTGVLAIGPNFSASDKNIMATFVQNINDYTQIIVQNPNAGTAASADFVVNNDSTTGAGVYGDFGINSSAFTGTGSLGLANATYLYSNGGDLALGTNTANQIHFVINAGATDAMTINTSGALALNGSFGTAGQVLTSQGSAAVPTWNTKGGFSGAGASITTALTSTGVTAALGVGTFRITAMIYGQSSSNAGGTFQIAYTGTTSSIDLMYSGQGTATSLVATGRITAVASATATLWGTANTEMYVMFSGVIVTTTSGTLTFNATKTTSGTMTIRAGSNLVVS